jgi:hypothetical protein
MWIFSGCGSGSGLGLFTQKNYITYEILYANFLENFVVDYIRYDFRTSKESFKSLVPAVLFGEKLKKGCRLLTIHNMGYLTF